MSKIAFLGLGAMGGRMAHHLLAAGHDLTVWNRTPGRADPLIAAGATRALTPGEAANGAEIVITMLTDDAASRAIWMGENGVLDGLDPAALVVEASTVSPAFIAELAQAVTNQGASFIDAPVAGSRPQADAGELIFLAGGAAENIARFEPVALAMGKAVLHAGVTGQGCVLKMIVNALLAVQTTAIGELLAYGNAHGLAPQDALELLAPTPVMSPAMQMSGQMILKGEHAPMFTIDLLVKDLGYLLADSDNTPIMAAVRGAFQAAQTAGLGGKHITAVADA